MKKLFLIQSYFKENTMKRIQFKHLGAVLALVAAFVLGMCFKPSAKPSIAVVNVEQVLGNYAKFTALRQINDAKLAELAQWIDGINKEIDEEKDQTKRNKLADQYRKLTQEKERMIRQEYGKYLQEINLEMTALIKKVAKQEGCVFVFSNTSMITGGKDITNAVIKSLKE